MSRKVFSTLAPQQVKKRNQNKFAISSYYSQNGNNQENNQPQKLRGMLGRRTLIHCRQNCKLACSLWKLIQRILKQLKMNLSYYTTLWHILKGLNRSNTSSTMPIITLISIARKWTQSKCPSADERVMKMWHTYTMNYYSAVRNI